MAGVSALQRDWRLLLLILCLMGWEQWEGSGSLSAWLELPAFLLPQSLQGKGERERSGEVRKTCGELAWNSLGGFPEPQASCMISAHSFVVRSEWGAQLLERWVKTNRWVRSSKSTCLQVYSQREVSWKGGKRCKTRAWSSWLLGHRSAHELLHIPIILLQV